MTRSEASLIARLRRRLVMSVWLFALLVLVKAGTATACELDAFNSSAFQATVTAADVSSIAGSATFANTDDGSGSGCWDSAKGSCHCSCAHTPVLSVDHANWCASFDPAQPVPLRPLVLISAPPHDALRPPIPTV